MPNIYNQNLIVIIYTNLKVWSLVFITSLLDCHVFDEPLLRGLHSISIRLEQAQKGKHFLAIRQCLRDLCCHKATVPSIKMCINPPHLLSNLYMLLFKGQAFLVIVFHFEFSLEHGC